MKFMSSLVVCLMSAAVAAPAFARDSRLTVPAAEGDLTTLGQADLRARLEWAKYYLSTLEANDRRIEGSRVPRFTSDKRTSYAVTKTVVESGLVAFTSYIGTLATREALKARAMMRDAAVTTTRENIRKLRRHLWAAPRAVKRGAWDPSVGPLDVHMKSYRADLAKERATLRDLASARYSSPIRRIGRATAMTLGIGITAALVTDMGITWFQVTREPADVEERKADLRDFIAYAEQKLSGDTSTAAQ